MIPSYLVKKVPKRENIVSIRKILNDNSIHTVCESAFCPNIGECFRDKTLTFMILGGVCTRNCAFCGVKSGTPDPVDKDEPQKIADAALKLGLDYVVVTSVTRDDLSDGGASHFSSVIGALKGKTIEVLIPDFNGDSESLKRVVDAKPSVINHNVETVPRLYSLIRPQADYGRSLKLLRDVKTMDSSICTKSGFMAGLGEEDAEIFELLSALKSVDCDIVTIGQYLPPSRNHRKAERYVPPKVFERFKEYGERIGILHVEAGPFVRSSFHAEEIWKKWIARLRK